MSRPPTPSKDVPTTRKQWRFEDTGFPSEWAEEYRPGGFHPVEIDDEFDSGRYRVIRKLGAGSYSTVWLAHDKQTSRYVAIKIMKAKASLRPSTEKTIYDLLMSKAKGDPLAEHVMTLIDTFEHTGPNGIHACLVFEPMGPSSASMVEQLPSNHGLPPGESPRYPKALAKVILKHALSCIAFLHKNGVVHGDIQPGNLLFKCLDLTLFGEERLRQPHDTFSPLLRRLDGKKDLWAPRYTVLGQLLVEFMDLNGPTMTVKLSDLGSAFWSNTPPSSTVTPVALRSPELVFHEPFNNSIDIWAFGCLIYEFLTGLPLFSPVLMGDMEQYEADDDHILDLTDVLGPLPDHLMKKWSRKDLWIGPQGERLQPHQTEYDGGDEGDQKEEEEGEGKEDVENDPLQGFETHDPISEGSESSPATPQADVPTEPFINDSLEILFDRHKPSDIDDEEAKVITALIRQILQYDLSLRPTAEELLLHPWFQT